MADQHSTPLRLQIDLRADQPGLLEGLEVWVRLGLISETQVLAIAQTHLVCAVPPSPQGARGPETAESDDPAPTAAPNPDDGWPTADTEADIFRHLPPPPVPDHRRRDPDRPPSPQPPTSAVALGWLNRLMSELSVVWLLGLGVFLIVLSSAVLAATQWARFDAVGQYLILLAYTLAFWGVGLVCRRRDHLHLTANTLSLITLLLVPLNGWAMDVLGVWGSAVGAGLGCGATVGLSLVTIQGLRQQGGNGLEQGNLLGLTYLHLGWRLPFMPLLAVYLGVLGSAAVTLVRSWRPPAPAGLGQATSPPPIRRPTLTLGLALGLLLLRALAGAAPTEWGPFGLALGLYAAPWVWLGQRHLSPRGSAASTRWPIGLGRLLLLGSWLITVADGAAQALGISTLGLGLRIQALHQLGRRRDVLVAYALAVQMGLLGWRVLPLGLRQGVTDPWVAWMGAEVWPMALLGLSLFPYVVGLVALAEGYYRRQQPRLAATSDGLALVSALGLTLVSLPVGRVLVVNLIATTVTTFVVTGRRSPHRLGLILTSYGLTIATILITLGQHWPLLPLTPWALVVVALAVLALLLSKVLPGGWGQGAWVYGLGLAAGVYGILGAQGITQPIPGQNPWSLMGFAIPMTMTLLGRYTTGLPTTALALLLTLGLPWTRLVGLAMATGLAAVGSAALRQPSVAFVTVAYGLGLIVATVEHTVPTFAHHWTSWAGITAALTLLLWGTWRTLPPSPAPDHPNPFPRMGAYRIACDHWGHLLTLGLLGAMTIIPRGPWGAGPPHLLAILALGGLGLALTLRYWGHPQPNTVYLGGWAVYLLVAEAMAWRWGSPLALAVPTLALGALALALATGFSSSQPRLAVPLQRLTLIYAGLAILLRSATTTAWTGWIVVGAALAVWEVGRRSREPLIRWMALGGLSVGWYELALYPITQAPGGAVADGLIILAGVAALMMGVYRLAAGVLQERWSLPPQELIWAAHLHWGLGSLLMLGVGLALGTPPAPLAWVGVGIALALVGYALLQGRLGSSVTIQSAWVYGGLVEWVGWFTLVRRLSPGLAGLDHGWGIVACALAVPVYWIPWSRWGWPQRPWRRMAIAVPLVVTLITHGMDSLPTLWVLVGFYGWLAWHSGRVRVSYLSVALAVWAVEHGLDQVAIHDPLAHRLPLSLALLYVAQVDPWLRTAPAREIRHWGRLAALGLGLVTALGLERWAGWPVGALSLAVVAVGLTCRIRAFLYGGTLIFGLNALNQLVLLNATYPFLKWLMGILMGVVLIWIAADVERRRTQWLQLTQTWMQDLDRWP